MTRRKDKKPGVQTSQDALQDYLRQMLFDDAAGIAAPAQSEGESTPGDSLANEAHANDPQAGGPSTDILRTVGMVLAAEASLVHTIDDLTAKSQRSASGQEKSVTEKFASDDFAEASDLQQKLLHARVKDLTEKSVQAVKEQHAQQQLQKAKVLQRAQQETERRERMDAARALVKQRIAARASPNYSAVETAKDRPHDAVVIEPDVVSEIVVAQPQAWLENGRPVWAQGAFECLLFSVSGLTLAVPLVELGSIYPVKDHLTPIIGQIDWFMGLLHVHGRNHVRTVNTAKIVMPEKYDASFVDGIRYVISINGFDWGLAVDNVDKAIKLVPDDVRWRSERSKRPWLAGTVVDYMCALVDVRELAVMLSRADHSKPRVRH